MVPHHQRAIAMAEELLEHGEQPGVRKLAGDIIGARTKQIAQMASREAWYESGMGSGAMGAAGRTP